MSSEHKTVKLFRTFTSLPQHLSPLLAYIEHVKRLAQQIIYFDQFGSQRLPPFYKEECTPALKPLTSPFLKALKIWEADLETGKAKFQKLLETTSLEVLLIMMGQRHTSASVTDERGIPPLENQLLASFNALHKHTLRVGARAWCKHANRSKENFWGEVKGNDEYKNQFALRMFNKIYQNCTWWNTFEHYKHGLVFEMRVKSGHGARWTKNGETFIGFLEPFIDE